MMNEIMLQEIEDQPQAIAESLPALRSQLATIDQTLLRSPRIILTGSGDSYFAPLALKFAAMLHLSSHVDVVPAIEAARYWPFHTTDVLVPISISGEAARTLEAVTRARREQVSTLAITGSETSSLAKASTASLVIPFHSRSRKTPHTTDYMTTLVAIGALIEATDGTRIELLDQLAATISSTLTSLQNPCQEFARSISTKEHIYILGGGPDYATAGYGAAKFWEAGGISALYFDSEEFAHGPHLLLDRGDPVVIVASGKAGAARALQLVDGLSHLESQMAVITDEPNVFPGITTLVIPSAPLEWSPFCATLPLQLLCWAIATEKGYDVIRKDGRIENPEAYEKAHFLWVRAAPSR